MKWTGAILISVSGVLAAAVIEGFADNDKSVLKGQAGSVASLSSTRQSREGPAVRERELTKLKEAVNVLGGRPHHAQILFSAGQTFDIDPLLLAAVTHVESSFKPDAKSKKNARGLMQLRPVVLQVLGVTNPWDCHDNIMAGAAYLRHCFDRYEFCQNATHLALAAYNVGPGPAGKLSGSEAADRFVKKVLGVYNRLTDDPIAVDVLRGTSGQRRSAWAEILELD
jgi:soluble lytic murein transglycosylase-like protein